MHAREWLNSQLVMKMIEQCASQYYTGSYGGRTYRRLFKNVCFYVIPMLNPDGVNISQYGLARIKDADLKATRDPARSQKKRQKRLWLL